MVDLVGILSLGVCGDASIVFVSCVQMIVS
jgi:hypothetical protein